ncbi:MAG: serine/threonine-protein kinase, partial [Myxococcota bacterium]
MTSDSNPSRKVTLIGNAVRSPSPPTPPPPPSTPRGPLAIGQRIAGRYVIQEWIGSGGMGVVYRAIEDEIEREVAMKFITARDGVSSTDERRAHDERFRREAQALGALPPHPNRVVLYQYGHDDGSDLNFMAMELVRGDDLATVLERATLTVEQILSYATQIVMALEDVHASGLVHRDLKPENLILTRSLLGDEQLKLIDFGIAHGPRADGAYPTHTGELIGTARYMAPELFTDGNQDDPRVDIYAIGVLMYEMVAARGPFDHLMEDEEDLEQVIRHHIVSEPAPLTSRQTCTDECREPLRQLTDAIAR